MTVYTPTTISITPVVGGFIVTYPTKKENGTIELITEVSTNLARAVRRVKAAGEEFSLVSKKDDETAE